jgi:hypothetical protein
VIAESKVRRDYRATREIAETKVSKESVEKEERKERRATRETKENAENRVLLESRGFSMQCIHLSMMQIPRR